jgi:hypothetical protein
LTCSCYWLLGVADAGRARAELQAIGHRSLQARSHRRGREEKMGGNILAGRGSSPEAPTKAATSNILLQRGTKRPAGANGDEVAHPDPRLGLDAEAKKMKEAPSSATQSASVPVVPWNSLTEEQRSQVEVWRRSKIDRSIIKDMISSHAVELASRRLAAEGTSEYVKVHAPFIRETTTITVGALAKMFIGDLVDGARASMSECGEPDDGRPIPKHHYLEAWRRLSEIGALPRVDECEVSVLAATPIFKSQPNDII